MSGENPRQHQPSRAEAARPDWRLEDQRPSWMVWSLVYGIDCSQGECTPQVVPNGASRYIGVLTVACFSSYPVLIAEIKGYAWILNPAFVLQPPPPPPPTEVLV